MLEYVVFDVLVYSSRRLSGPGLIEGFSRVVLRERTRKC